MKNSPTRTLTAKRIAVAVAAVCATMSAPSFAAGEDMKALMDLLLKKGVITQQEYDQNIKAAQDAAETQAFKEKRLSDDVTKLNKLAEKNKDTGSVMKNGIGIQSADGKYTAVFTGRVHMDWRTFQENSTAPVSTAGLSSRRIRFGFKGKMTDDFDYMFLGDWSDGSSTTTSQTRIDEGWFEYVGFKPLHIRVGKIKTPFALDKQTSSNNIDFMERAMIVTDDKELIPGNQFGLMALGSPISGLSYAIAKHSGASGTESAAHADSDTTGRLTFNFAEIMGNKDLVTHFGTAYSVGRVGSAAANPNANTEGKGAAGFLPTSAAALATGSDRTRTGYEAAVAYGPLKIQGEHINVNYDNRAGATYDTTGWHVQAMWNLTGENHNYSNSTGTFGWIKPKQPFSTSNGGLGAWQLGARYSTLASNANTAANKTNYATGTTLGLNWILNDNNRVMLNYVVTNFDSQVSSTGLTQEKAVNMRYQLWF